MNDLLPLVKLVGEMRSRKHGPTDWWADKWEAALAEARKRIAISKRTTAPLVYVELEWVLRSIIGEAGCTCSLGDEVLPHKCPVHGEAGDGEK